MLHKREVIALILFLVVILGTVGINFLVEYQSQNKAIELAMKMSERTSDFQGDVTYFLCRDFIDHTYYMDTGEISVFYTKDLKPTLDEKVKYQLCISPSIETEYSGKREIYMVDLSHNNKILIQTTAAWKKYPSAFAV